MTVFSAGRHDFTNQSSCPVHPAWTRSFTANPPLPPHAPLHFPPSTPLGTLANDGILCWQAWLHKSVVVPRSPSMDELIHSKSTTSAPYAAESGVSPPDSVSLLDEEKSILAAIQKSLSSAEAEVFHQGPNGGSTHPNLILSFSRRLASLPTMVFSAGRHDFTNQSSRPIHPALGFLANDGVLCWEARLQHSVVTPCS
jgi:hypothetical protein